MSKYLVLHGEDETLRFDASTPLKAAQARLAIILHNYHLGRYKPPVDPLVNVPKDERGYMNLTDQQCALLPRSMKTHIHETQHKYKDVQIQYELDKLIYSQILRVVNADPELAVHMTTHYHIHSYIQEDNQQVTVNTLELIIDVRSNYPYEKVTEKFD